jgi:hypothetical protein
VPSGTVRVARWRTPALWISAAAITTVLGASLWSRRPFHPGNSAGVIAAASTIYPFSSPRQTVATRATTAGGCSGTNKPVLEISGSIDRDSVLRCDSDYLLKFTTYVKQGATLTIEKGTKLIGDQATKGVLVVQPGGRIVAQGTAAEPIVFTSDSATPAPGDWGGVIILGNAPVNLHGVDGRYAQGRVEGLTSGASYGGGNPRDDSGVLSYVRIEYAGTELAPNNEVNGLTLAGVGSGTRLDHIQVRHTSDDCFEFFGGTVDAKHLICQHSGDDGFDWDLGYSGRLQFLVYQAAPKTDDDSNGFEGDNDPNATANTPTSNPQIWNATLCGPFKRPGKPGGKANFGALLRRGTHATIANTIFTGFDAGLEVRDIQTKVDVRASNFFGNVRGLAQPASFRRSATTLDDEHVDETALLLGEGRRNFSQPVGLARCNDSPSPDLTPERPSIEHALTPPDDDFFDPSATFVGAFRGEGDDWASGTWVRWD